ncbi:MAG: ABC transporter permease, partial [Eubacteriales bacterium]
MKKKINGYLLAGLIITGIILIAILVGAFWTPYSPTAMKYGRFQPPSFSHLFGTDNFGRDIFSRVLKGAGTTFSIALSTVAIGALAGTVIGAVTGYFGGLADDILMRMNDALTAFPSFLLALLVVSLVGPGNKYSVVIALGLVFIPSFARVMRTEYASLRNQNYVTGARLMGVG